MSQKHINTLEQANEQIDNTIEKALSQGYDKSFIAIRLENVCHDVMEALVKKAYFARQIVVEMWRYQTGHYKIVVLIKPKSDTADLKKYITLTGNIIGNDAYGGVILNERLNEILSAIESHKKPNLLKFDVIIGKAKVIDGEYVID